MRGVVAGRISRRVETLAVYTLVYRCFPCRISRRVETVEETLAGLGADPVRAGRISRRVETLETRRVFGIEFE